MKTVGLDLSMKSTGVCVKDHSSGKCQYYIIANKMTKKQQNFSHSDVFYVPYEWQKPDKEDPFQIREQKKTSNVWNVTSAIRTILQSIKKKSRKDEIECVIEGISYGSSSSAALADLAGLNYAVRFMLTEEGIPFRLAAPTQLKKFAVGNGNADKEMMIAAWKKCQPEIADIDGIKDDDIADAYFLSVYEDA